MPPETFPIALLALLLDAAFGYPDWVFRKAGHPVTWIGALIGFADRRLNKESSSRLARKLAGVLAIVCVIAAASATGLLIQIAAGTLPYGWALTAIAASSALCKPQPLYPRSRRGRSARKRRARSRPARRLAHRRARSRNARLRWRVPRRHRKLGRKRLGRRGRAGFLVRSSGAAGPCRLQSHQHRRQHDRPPHPAPRSVRLGSGAARRPREPAGLKAERGAVRSRRAPIGATALRAT